MSTQKSDRELLTITLGALGEVSDSIYYREPEKALAYVQTIKDQIRHHLHEVAS